MSKRHFSFLGALVALLSVPGTSWAETFPHRDVATYQLKAEVDLPLLLAPTAIGVATLVGGELEPPHCATEENQFVCDPSGVNSFDRGAVNNRDENWRTLTDWAVPGVMLFSLSSVLIAEDVGPFLNDAVVGLEAVMVTTAINAIVTNAVDRPRPWAYNSEIPLEERLSGRNKLSFFSGHTAAPAAATTYAFATLRKRGVHPAYSWGTLALGTGVTSLIGAGRVLAGKHFATDVIAGGLVGGSVGLLLPELHRSNFLVILEVSGRRVFVSGSVRF